MSLDAITWARAQTLGKGSLKAVFMALADYAGETWLSYVSTETICNWTEQDRKTVLANLGKLRDSGWIIDTGKRVGVTAQIVVYRINLERGVPVTIGPRQEPNSPKNGTVPFFPDNSTVFPRNSTVFPPKQSQKRDTEQYGTVRTVGNGISGDESPASNPPKAKRVTKAERARIDGIAFLVDKGVDERHAADWMTARGDSAITETAWARHCSQAAEVGMTPAQAVEYAAGAGWKAFTAAYWRNQNRTDAPRGGAADAAGKSERAFGALFPSAANQLKRGKDDGRTIDGHANWQ
ncbi:helix-turn-helix domain-containing protein [Paraburkholderia sp. BR10936]|uniref:helix-turn-helix domain-containing protein n=1 Tax=Paraburkholderia sp. BR10936 TaxID=3236993 RepID=UPI0034D20A64